MSRIDFVTPELDCWIRTRTGHYKHVVIDQHSYTLLPFLKSTSLKKGIKVVELSGRLLKWLQPIVLIVYASAAFLGPGKLGADMRWVRQMVSPWAKTLKGATFVFNPCGWSDETGLQRDWFRLLCPGLMMVMGLNGIAKFLVNTFVAPLRSIPLPRGFISAWNTTGMHLSWFGALSSSVFMWLNVGTWSSSIKELEEATYIGGRSSSIDLQEYIEKRNEKLLNHQIDLVKYLVDFGDFLLPTEIKAYWESLGYFAGVSKSLISCWNDEITQDLKRRWSQSAAQIDHAEYDRSVA